ncbi:MAG: hypothetical protein PHP06_00425 [Clostridia bacterium]|nr:hypothetical protein [Clostridia bacterium]
MKKPKISKGVIIGLSLGFLATYVYKKSSGRDCLQDVKSIMHHVERVKQVIGEAIEEGMSQKQEKKKELESYLNI